jgi:uncharacterized protein
MSNASAVNMVLLKLANTCNLDCSYCYWFKDKSVYENNKLITQGVLDAFYDKLRKHIITHKPKTFLVTLHGGEPLLAGKKKVEEILETLYALQIETDTRIKILIQTNGLLIDDEWIDLLKAYNVSIGVSMDGPQAIQDLYRKDLRGRPTYERTVKVLDLLIRRNTDFGILAVYNPAYTAEYICNFFVETLDIKTFEILIPDANYESGEVPEIKQFYIDLIKLWYEKYQHMGVKIRIARNILKGMLGARVSMQTIGYSPVQITMIKPNGELEAFDILHSLGYGFTKNKLNILENDLIDIQEDPIWSEVYKSSLTLNEKCEKCKHKMICGGGHIATRWSAKNRFDNPSVYCDQLYEIYETITQYVNNKEISLEKIA